MKPWLKTESLKQITRRYFLEDCWSSIGAIALTSFFNEKLFAEAVNPMAPRKPQFPAKAKRVLFLGMSGGPSQLDLFDFKPKLNDLHGKPIPKSIVGDQRYAFIKPESPLRGTERKFKKHGKCGMEMSELLPNIASVADDICLVRSMTTDLFNHAPAELFLFTGFRPPGPSQHGKLGDLRARQRSERAARLCGSAFDQPGLESWNSGRSFLLVQRISSHHASGRGAAKQRRPGFEPLRSARG